MKEGRLSNTSIPSQWWAQSFSRKLKLKQFTRFSLYQEKDGLQKWIFILISVMTVTKFECRPHIESFRRRRKQVTVILCAGGVYFYLSDQDSLFWTLLCTLSSFNPSLNPCPSLNQTRLLKLHQATSPPFHPFIQFLQLYLRLAAVALQATLIGTDCSFLLLNNLYSHRKIKPNVPRKESWEGEGGGYWAYIQHQYHHRGKMKCLQWMGKVNPLLGSHKGTMAAYNMLPVWYIMIHILYCTVCFM